MNIPRDYYLNKLKSRMWNGLIKVITGSRRSGKSTLLNELFYIYLLNQGVKEKNIIRFAFDSDENIDVLDDYIKEEPSTFTIDNARIVNSKKFRAYLKSKTNDEEKFYIFLDEIQNLDNFVGSLNGLLTHKNFDVYVTGSNSRFLSKDIITEFRGRGSQIHILPLSFKEYVEGLSLTPEEGWKNYIITGGIPVVALMKTFDEQSLYLKNLSQEIYLKDIIFRNKINKSIELNDLFKILASDIGCFVNPNKLQNTFKSILKKKISHDTIDKYIEYFENSFLISKAKRYNIKGRKYIGSLFKIYFEDIGVRNAILNFNQIEETHIMENVIYNELRLRGFNVDIGEISINEKTDKLDKNRKSTYVPKSYEVDFIATKGNEKYYIQSALSLNDLEKENREKRPLYYIDDSFKKIIITKNNLKPFVDEKGITVIDLFDFLLNKNPANSL